MTIDPSIFKAYDVRGLYPEEIDEAGARAIGRAFVAYLGATRIAVSRDMRLSSPALAAAFIDGARAQGADVVDYGLCGTDMLYFGVARDGLDGGAQITASHNPKAYNGIKMVRREAFPLSGDAGIGEIRDMIAAGTIPAPTRATGAPRIARPAAVVRRQGPVVHRSGGHQAVQRRARRRQRHGRPGRAAALRPAPLPHDAAVLRHRRHLPESRSQPADRGEPRATSSSA